MNEDESLENQIRSLRPGPIPQDLKERLAAEPRPSASPYANRVIVWVAGAGLMAAACLAFMVDWSGGPRGKAEASKAPLSILQQDSTLLNRRPITIKEYDGQLWEIAEEEWRDDTVALCSATPVRVRSTVIRRETVCEPVDFL